MLGQVPRHVWGCLSVGVAWNTQVARWDAAINQALTDFDVVIANAVAASEPVLAGTTTDSSPLNRIWQPVEAAMHRATDAVSDAWDDISDDMSELDDVPEVGIDREGHKRDVATTEIEVRHGRARATTYARAAVMMQRHAATNPDQATAQRMFGATGAPLLAEHAAIENWAAMMHAQTQINGYREKKDVPMPLLEHYAEASATYWRIRHSVEAEHNPAQQAHLATKIERFVGEAHKLLRQHPQWRRR